MDTAPTTAGLGGRAGSPAGKGRSASQGVGPRGVRPRVREVWAPTGPGTAWPGAAPERVPRASPLSGRWALLGAWLTLPHLKEFPANSCYSGGVVGLPARPQDPQSSGGLGALCGPEPEWRRRQAPSSSTSPRDTRDSRVPNPAVSAGAPRQHLPIFSSSALVGGGASQHPTIASGPLTENVLDLGSELQGRPEATPPLLGAAGQALDRASGSSHPLSRPIPTCPLPAPCPVPVSPPCCLPCPYVSPAPILSPHVPSLPSILSPLPLPFPTYPPTLHPTPIGVLLGQARPQCPPGSHCPR